MASAPPPPRTAHGHVRIAVVQLSPVFRSPAASTARIEQLLEAKHLSRPGQVDLLVLPEMALGGYKFSGPEEIRPVLENTPSDDPSSSAGPTLSLARSLATRLRAYVLIGFAQQSPTKARQRGTGASSPTDSRPQDRPVSPAPLSPPASWLYNAALLVDREGKVLHVFAKHFLYEDDKKWSRSGQGFQYIDLDIGRLAVGICMDMNPYDFTAPFEAYELARYAARVNAHFLAIPMAWALPEDEVHLSDASHQTESADIPDPTTPSKFTINYWAWRCAPLWDQELFGPGSPPKRTVVIACDRVGHEKGTTFAGSSSVFLMDPHVGRPVLLDCLGARQEDVLLVSAPVDQS